MAEEEKKESCCSASKGAGAIGKILIGVILMVLGAYLCYRWLIPLKILVKACLGPFLILVGLVFIAIAKE
ncbi:MAG: hypothetical protein ABIA97_01210 [Candidatus Omnitrophota bacterium]